MKTKNAIECRAPGVERRKTNAGIFAFPRLSTFDSRPGFTLIELLVVIFIIGGLAGLIFPVMGTVKRQQYIKTAQAQLGQLDTAINAYKDAHGFYPPDNTNALINQLYYELEGTTNNGTTFTTLDGASSIKVSDVPAAFSGVGGFVNSSKPGSSEESGGGKNFLHELKPGQTQTVNIGVVPVTVLTTSVGGPDATYNPLGMAATAGVNPWRYKSSGTLTNNPGAYELWVQLSVSGKTYLVCNWNKQPQVNNNSLP
jgi:prepilin-type N-terminal cleavage/methylation domain-containing protein